MRKLIEFYPDLLTETGAGEEAKKRGLKSIGFGRYVDPSTNKVVAKSVKGKLVSVKPHEAGKEKKKARADSSGMPSHPIGKRLGIPLPFDKLLEKGKEGHMELVKDLAKLPLKQLRSAQMKLDPILQKLYAEMFPILSQIYFPLLSDKVYSSFHHHPSLDHIYDKNLNFQ